MTTASLNIVNEVYNELKDVIVFLQKKNYGSTLVQLSFTLSRKEIQIIYEHLVQDGLEVRQEGRWNLQIIWNDVEKTCFYGRDISMAPSYNIIQSLEFQYPDEYQ